MQISIMQRGVLRSCLMFECLITIMHRAPMPFAVGTHACNRITCPGPTRFAVRAVCMHSVRVSERDILAPKPQLCMQDLQQGGGQEAEVN